MFRQTSDLCEEGRTCPIRFPKRNIPASEFFKGAVIEDFPVVRDELITVILFRRDQLNLVLFCILL